MLMESLSVVSPSACRSWGLPWWPGRFIGHVPDHRTVQRGIPDDARTRAPLGGGGDYNRSRDPIRSGIGVDVDRWFEEPELELSERPGRCPEGRWGGLWS